MSESSGGSLEYGSKGQNWSSEFIVYMNAIVTHPVYAGMPDAIKEDGKIQWEAPSNRGGGLYQYTHNKRREWWRKKAQSIGIDHTKDKWISTTAKAIHPSGEKPCKKCGCVMQLAYVYPNSTLISRFKRIFGDDFSISLLEPIDVVIQRAYDIFGKEAINKISIILSTTDVTVPKFDDDLDAFLEWINDSYIPQESSLLSPGAMSNAPDRLDGFHSFNRCCRGIADKGRNILNLLSYTTDRRVFEFWSEGDWIAADRLMGLIKSKFNQELNEDGGDGPPTADHIGPISLGFSHRPEFKLLSKTANSTKNNRMSLRDIQHLVKREQSGIQITSWYATPLWDLNKANILNDEMALNLSKQLRDNQRNAIHILCEIYNSEKYSFLVYLLDLGYADRNIDFKNLRIENFITVFDELIASPRNNKYATEQKARRLKVGFEALRAYKEKENRHVSVIAKDDVDLILKEAVNILNKADTFREFDLIIKDTLLPTEGIISEEKVRAIVSKFPTDKIEIFETAKSLLIKAMTIIAKAIFDLSTTNRYARENFED